MSPRASTTPARTAAPLPLLRGSRMILLWGSDASWNEATSAVASVLPSSTTMTSVSS